MPTDRAMEKSEYERKPADWYPTPPWCLEAVLDLFPLNGDRVWEPAAGDGPLIDVMAKAGLHICATDLHDYGRPDVTSGIDFMTSPASEVYNNIVTNPPYKIAVPFVRRALDMVVNDGHKGMVAMLLRNEWDAAKTRNDLFTKEAHFWGKVVLTTRPHWVSERSNSPRHNFAWMIWRYSDNPPEPRIWYRGKEDAEKYQREVATRESQNPRIQNMGKNVIKVRKRKRPKLR